MLLTASVCFGERARGHPSPWPRPPRPDRPPNAEIIFHNATEASRAQMDMVSSVYVERQPGYRCTGNDQASCTWVPGVLAIWY